jgi:hypothetical protein
MVNDSRRSAESVDQQAEVQYFDLIRKDEGCNEDQEQALNNIDANYALNLE